MGPICGGHTFFAATAVVDHSDGTVLPFQFVIL